MPIREDGWLEGARIVPTSWFDSRPEGAEVSLIVIHYTSLPPNSFGGGFVDQLFTGRIDPNAHPYFKALAGFKCSAHFFIDRFGKVTQYVSCNDRAWHAGRSSYHGHKECNDYSVGIELEGCSWCAYTSEQYGSLIPLIADLRARYPAIGRNIAGHSDVAPGRKQDPGPWFDWERVRASLR